MHSFAQTSQHQTVRRLLAARMPRQSTEPRHRTLSHQKVQAPSPLPQRSNTSWSDCLHEDRFTCHVACCNLPTAERSTSTSPKTYRARCMPGDRTCSRRSSSLRYAAPCCHSLEVSSVQRCPACGCSPSGKASPGLCLRSGGLQGRGRGRGSGGADHGHHAARPAGAPVPADGRPVVAATRSAEVCAPMHAESVHAQSLDSLDHVRKQNAHGNALPANLPYPCIGIARNRHACADQSVP